MWPFGKKVAKDPVCGMDVEPKKAAATATHEAKTYYFCSRGCKDRFEREPMKYVMGSGTAHAH